MNKLLYRFYVFFIMSFILVTTLCQYETYAQNSIKEKLNILFISSYNSYFISFDDQVKGIKAGFNNDINLRVEYMDSKVLENKESEENFYNLLKYSFESYEKFDAIIAGDDYALKFCLKYRNDLFTGIPISFLGIQKDPIIKEAFQYELVSGVKEVESIEENIELIKKFHPNVKKIFFLNNSGDSFYEEITKKYDELTFNKIITEDLSISMFREVISNLDNTSAIISLYPNDFKYGEWLSTTDVNELIKSVNYEIPIYSVLSYGMDSGSIGGKLISHFNQGKMAAEIALRLLNGENPIDIYIGDDSANEYIFDYKELNRFDINRGDIPKNSIIINDPINVIKEYKELVIGIGLTFIALLILIIFLIKYICYKRKYEKQIIIAMNKSEEANKLKTHFISNISHELKTPINVILSAVQLMELTSLKSELNYNKYSVIKENCYRLTRLLNNIIDIQKVELNDIRLNLENINIVNLIEELVLSIVPYAESKNINLIFDTNEEEIITKIDINKIERAILNLISNAIKFSNDDGNVFISLDFEETKFKIIIEDDGIGIHEKDISRVFDRFTQVDNSLTRNNEGSGIGLSIVKSFIQLHNGKITVESKVNEGTKFIIELPINKVNENEKVNEVNFIDNSTKIELSDIYI
ncbi:ABC transporter substrate binding protein [Clostridioides difficile]